MDRAPGLSVRLKLTLSYAGFLMVAGVLLLAVVWVFLLRYVPDRPIMALEFIPNRSDLLRAFAPHDGSLTLNPRAAGGLCATVQLPAGPPHTGR